jgi:hypothetical protein
LKHAMMNNPAACEKMDDRDIVIIFWNWWSKKKNVFARWATCRGQQKLIFLWGKK